MNEEVAGWIAFYNRKKLEIKKGTDAKDLYSAKLFAIKHFKVPKSKQGLLAIEPAYESIEKTGEVMSEDNTDYSQHRTIISHALKSEPSQIKPIFNQIVRDKINDRIESRRGEIADTLFSDSNESVDEENIDEAKKDQKKVKWMKDFDDSVKKNHPKQYKGNIDWDTATHLYNTGKSPEEAAKSKPEHILKL